MPWYVIVPGISLIVGAWVFNDMALANLADESEETKRKALRLGGFASRRLFSDTGWRYRRYSLWCGYAWLLVLLLWGIVEALV